MDYNLSYARDTVSQSHNIHPAAVALVGGSPAMRWISRWPEHRSHANCSVVVLGENQHQSRDQSPVCPRRRSDSFPRNLFLRLLRTFNGFRARCASISMAHHRAVNNSLASCERPISRTSFSTKSNSRCHCQPVPAGEPKRYRGPIAAAHAQAGRHPHRSHARRPDCHRCRPGSFREDFCFRLDVVTTNCRRCASHMDDILPFAPHFLRLQTTSCTKPKPCGEYA